MALVLSFCFNAVNCILAIVIGEKYREFIMTAAKFWTLVQKIVKSNSLLENKLNDTLDRLVANETMVRNLTEVVATLEKKISEQSAEIEELKVKVAAVPPQPLPRSTAPPPPPPPMPSFTYKVPLPHQISEVDSTKPKKAKKEVPSTPLTSDTAKALTKQRPSSSELRKRKGQLRPTRSPGGTPLGPMNRKIGPGDVSDLNGLMNKALKEQFKNYRPPSPIAGSPNSTFGSDDFSFTFRT